VQFAVEDAVSAILPDVTTSVWPFDSRYLRRPSSPETLPSKVPVCKAEIMPYLEHLHDELDIPVLYGHAPDEVARLADHLVLLAAGKVVASGATADLLTRLDLDVAHGNPVYAQIKSVRS